MLFLFIFFLLARERIRNRAADLVIQNAQAFIYFLFNKVPLIFSVPYFTVKPKITILWLASEIKTQMTETNDYALG